MLGGFYSGRRRGRSHRDRDEGRARTPRLGQFGLPDPFPGTQERVLLGVGARPGRVEKVLRRGPRGVLRVLGPGSATTTYSSSTTPKEPPGPRTTPVESVSRRLGLRLVRETSEDIPCRVNTSGPPSDLFSEDPVPHVPVVFWDGVS